MSLKGRRRRQYRLVMVANTLPVRRQRRNGGAEWVASPGGLVSALAPVTRARGGAWVGWTGERGRRRRPFAHDGIWNVPVTVSADEARGSYEGVCNRTLWPLYHDAVRQPEYHRTWWRAYQEVNRRFAERAAEVAARGALVWIHDYHLQLAPAMLRHLRPDLRIGFFLHIPFPPDELFAHLPWRENVLRGLLGADVIGFQIPPNAQNFVQAARRFLGVSGSGAAITVDDRTVRVGAFPISIDVTRFEEAARREAVHAEAERLRARLGTGRIVFLGVDRLDYTKGIDLRLEAFRHLLERLDHGRELRPVLLQVAVPSRERIHEYRVLRRQVEELVGKINGDFGEVGRAVVHYLRRTLPFEELVAMYRAADVMLVTPLADGMNLVSKEYVATRYDDTGMLVLSEFAGSAEELTTALQVNPHDVDGFTEAMVQAATLSEAERRRRMRAMRRAVQRHTVQDWAESLLDAVSAAGAAAQLAPPATAE